jgi:hypothetical protein
MIHPDPAANPRSTSMRYQIVVIDRQERRTLHIDASNAAMAAAAAIAQASTPHHLAELISVIPAATHAGADVAA